MINSLAIHLAHAFDATYFPFKDPKGYSDEIWSGLIKSHLAFFRAVGQNKFSDYLNEYTSPFAKPIGLPGIELLEVFPFSLVDTASILGTSFSREGARSLLSMLNELSPDDQALKISEFNERLISYRKKKVCQDKLLDIGKNGAVDLFGFFSNFPFSGTIIALIAASGKFSKLKEAVEKLHDKVNPVEFETSLLSKIHKVARLQKQKTE